MSIEVLAKILDWLQRIIIIYSNGIDAFPAQIRPLINRAKIDKVTDGMVYYLIKNCEKHCEVVDGYSTTVSTNSKGFHPFDLEHLPQSIRLSVFILRGECFALPKILIRSNEIDIIINENDLLVTNLDSTLYNFTYIAEFLVLKSKVDILTEFKFLEGIIPFAFVKSTFSITDKLWKKFKQKKMELAEAYLDENVDFNKAVLSELIIDLGTKITDGDLEFYTWFVTHEI